MIADTILDLVKARLGIVRLPIALIVLCGAAHAQLSENALGEVSAYTGWTNGAIDAHPVVGGSTAIQPFFT